MDLEVSAVPSATGELFPIDVGEGTTYEGRWDTFAQKYIGSLNECYRMSLKSLCGLAASDQHGEDKYHACLVRCHSQCSTCALCYMCPELRVP